MGKNTAFVHELYIRSTPAEVWRALTDPALTSRYWYGSNVSSDWKVGSPILFRSAQGDAQIEGTILEAEPNKKLAYTQRYVWDPALAKEEPSRIAYDIDGNGEVTHLTITQDGFADGSGALEATRGGSPWIFSGLKTLLETGTSLPGGGPA